MAIQPLTFRITADLSGLNAGLSQVTARLRGAGDQVRQAFAGTTQATTAGTTAATTGVSTLIGRLGGLAVAYAALRTIGAFARIADEAALATARIHGLTGSMTATREAQAGLFEISQRLQAGYGEAVSSFSRMLPAVKELGGGVKETTALTEILLTTAKLSGASAAEASASAMQFAQALGSGTLQGDELRSILENNNTLARTLAEGLGVSIGELRRMGEEGKLTSEMVAKVLLGQYDEVKAKAAELPGTVGGAWTEVRNAFMLFVTSMESGSGVFSAIGQALSEVAKVITIVAKSFFSAGDESDKLGRQQGARSFAEFTGRAFAWLADVVRAAIQSSIEIIRAFYNAVFTVAGAIGNVFHAIGQAMSGDFTGAANTMRTQGSLIGDAWSQIADAAVNSFDRTKTAIMGGGDALRAYEKQLAETVAKAEPGPDGSNLKSKGKGDDADGSKSRKDTARQLEEDLDAIEKSIQAERRRFAVAQEAAQIRTEMDRDRALASIEAESRVSKFFLDTQQITQAQYLQAEMVFEEQKYAIRRAAVERQLLLAQAEGRDPAEVERINQKLLDLELDFQTRKHQIQLEVQKTAGGGAAGQVAGSAWDAMKNSMGQALDSMLTRAKTFGQAMAGIWGNMRAAILGEITKILMAKIASFAREKVLALANISTKAAEAGAGAAASQASIPVVGPGLAMAAMAAVFAAVMGMGGGMKSAAGGYDIPAGLNPVTQLHAEEMVLPADIANPMREMTRGGAASAPPIELRGVSAGEFFIAVRKDLVAALKGAHREFAF